MSLEEIKAKIEGAVSGVRVEFVPNEAPGQPASLRLDNAHAFAAAKFLRDELKYDYASNVTGVDYLDTVTKQKVKKKQVVDGQEKEVEETIETRRAGYLEVVYHLYSMALKSGPVVIRLRSGNRTDQVEVPSLTPLYRGAEFQEREVFDLYGVVFAGHPDLRRLLMWDGYQDHPMRKDYVEPDDYEYEPTAHDQVLERAKAHEQGTGVKGQESGAQ
jgi:NADH-quinone oxidoreductase subunit C